MEADRAKQYCDQLEAHMEAGGAVAANNVRDLIHFVRAALSSPPDDYAEGIEAALEAIRTFQPQTFGTIKDQLTARIRSLLGTKPTAGERLPYDVLLRERDEFIVQKGLWDDFCEWLKVNDKLPPVTAGERGSIVAWRPITDAPKTGEIVWAYLYDSGVRAVQWVSAEETAAEEGGEPSDYIGAWCEIDDHSETWSPKWWIPYSALVPPIERGDHLPSRDGG